MTRVVHITSYKCGSQWVRDVLTAPGILEFSDGLRYSGVTGAFPGEHEWPEIPPGSVSGPIYQTSWQQWHSWAGADDKAVVVLRDPRDVAISWLYSMAYSHQKAPGVDLMRKPLLAVDLPGQLVIAATVFRARMARAFYSWARRRSTRREHVTRYERLVADPVGEYRAIFDFLAWPVPQDVLEKTVVSYSFAAQSGREPGDEDIHSHFRKGVPGDWRRHFDRATGRMFEDLCPDLLANLGYETDPRWYETLPPTRSATVGAAPNRQQVHELQAEIVRLQEANRRLRGALATPPAAGQRGPAPPPNGGGAAARQDNYAAGPGVLAGGMNYRRLGRTGLEVSVIGFGTAQLRKVPEIQAIETLLTGFQLGVNIVHVAPDYEGAEDLVAKAVSESGREVVVSSQGYDRQGNESGRVDHFERLFESMCEKLGRDRLELFGIACIDDREALRENVWGPGGMVEFLQRKKEEGRLGSLFCTTHGSPDYICRLIDRNVFDALMVAYNVLGFHLLSVHHPQQDRRESLPENAARVFPLARERDVGLMIMKPLAGGLLSSSKAFPPRIEIGHGAGWDVAEILRSILLLPGVSCVTPGTASIEEAKENALAGHGDLGLSSDRISALADHVLELQASVCSRCGECDKLCSQSLPVSWLFRAAYVSFQPSEAYETWEDVEYFRLHPGIESTCSACPDVTCACPYGIRIPETLARTHRQMVSLMERGLVQPPPEQRAPPVGDATFSARVLAAELPEQTAIGGTFKAGLWLENTGKRGWFVSDAFPNAGVRLAVYIDGTMVRTVRLREDTHSGQRAHFSFDVQAPADAGRHRLALRLLAEHQDYSEERGLVLHDAGIDVAS